MSFVIKDDEVLDKYNEIQDKIKETLSIKFHSIPVYDEQNIKVKVREYNGVIKTIENENKCQKKTNITLALSVLLLILL